MRASLLFLPFIALIIVATGAALGSALPDLPWIANVCYGGGALLLFTWIALDFESFKNFFTRKGAKYGASSGLVTLIGIAIIVALAILTNRPRFNKSWDLTRNAANTLSLQSKKIAEKLGTDQKVAVKALAFFDNADVKTNFADLIDMYLREGAALEIDYIDPNLEPQRAIAENITSFNTVIFKSGTREARVSTFNEEKITNALINVLKEKSKTIYFTTGHGEGAIDSQEPEGFSFVVQELKNNRYEVKELSLLENMQIPDDADLVIVAGPKYEFKSEEAKLLDTYLASGGAVMVLADALAPVTNLNSFLKPYGLEYNNDLVIFHPNDQRAKLFGTATALVTEFDDFNPITKDFATQGAVSLLMHNTRTIGEIEENAHEMKVSMVAKTMSEAARIKNVAKESDLASGIEEDRLDFGSFSVIASAIGKTKGPTLAENTAGESEDTVKSDVPQPVEESKSQEIRLVALGSAQFAMNGSATQMKEHLDMFVNASNYLLQDEDFISIRPKDIGKSELSLTSESSQFSFLFTSFLYPFIFLGFGVWFWMRRKAA